ncbi:hypothetical protein EYF80_056788 [Liparis tanakae]|uniref:Uncharacterized protein n=1 Tax=Liparis tanakae TaxID=230148 RepID=A0A4Z2EVY0_9TELE|nr:hypothetical protein EYF80_056788 [Liparis tanakae]
MDSAPEELFSNKSQLPTDKPKTRAAQRRLSRRRDKRSRDKEAEITPKIKRYPEELCRFSSSLDWPSLSSCTSCSSSSRPELWLLSSVLPLELGGPPGAPVVLLAPAEPDVALEQSSSLPYLGLGSGWWCPAPGSERPPPPPPPPPAAAAAAPAAAAAAAPPSSAEASSRESFSDGMLSALPNRWRISEAISRGLETTAPAAECVAWEKLERPPFTLSTTPSLKPALLHVPQHVLGVARDAIVLRLPQPAVVVLQLPLQLLDALRRLLVLLLKNLAEPREGQMSEGEPAATPRLGPAASLTCLMRALCCRSALLASCRYSATLSSLAVCSTLICSVSLRIFCCSWAIACLVRCGSGAASSAPGNEPSAPHDTARGVWPRPLTSSRSI